VWQRIFWAVSAGAAAGVLLLFGGLQALQTAAITTALPFCAIMLVMAYSLWRGLRDERAAAAPHAASTGEAVQPPAPAQGPRPWAARLRAAAERKGRPRRAAAAGAPPGSAAGLIEGVALPAFAEIAEELRAAGREARIERGPALAALTVLREGREEFYYAVRLRAFQRMAFAFPEPPRGAGALELRAEIVLRSGPRAEFDAARLTREGLIRNFLDEYASWTG
jgi:choline/glycine/proline betaine transport protein